MLEWIRVINITCILCQINEMNSGKLIFNKFDRFHNSKNVIKLGIINEMNYSFA